MSSPRPNEAEELRRRLAERLRTGEGIDRDDESLAASRLPTRAFDRITSDPQVLGGRACIRGLRVTVSLILNLTANGMTPEEIVEAYLYLELEDVSQALRYAAWLAEKPVDLDALDYRLLQGLAGLAWTIHDVGGSGRSRVVGGWESAANRPVVVRSEGVGASLEAQGADLAGEVQASARTRRGLAGSGTGRSARQRGTGERLRWARRLRNGAAWG